jgi:hypothetical protein
MDFGLGMGRLFAEIGSTLDDVYIRILWLQVKEMSWIRLGKEGNLGSVGEESMFMVFRTGL